MGRKFQSYDWGAMQRLWCWRCKCDMPMLDEQEYAEVTALFRGGMRNLKNARAETEEALKSVPLSEHFGAMLKRYEAITGFRETNPNAVMHHRLSLYGPLCERCGKPLRTPKAKLCGSCMAPRCSLKD